MPVSNPDLLRWQALSYQALGDFLTAARLDGLPAIAWMIASSGAVTGTVDSLTTDVDGQRAAFNVWAARLSAKASQRVDRSGVTYLYGTFAWAGNHRVVGALRATLVPGMGVGGGA